MNRDTRGRFKSKELIFSFPSAAMIVNSIFVILILLPWIYVAFKFNLAEKVHYLLNSLFFDDSKCKCQNLDNVESKY